MLTPVLYSRETRILWSRNHKGVFVFFVTQKYFRQYKTLRYKNMHLFFDELFLFEHKIKSLEISPVTFQGSDIKINLHVDFFKTLHLEENYYFHASSVLTIFEARCPYFNPRQRSIRDLFLISEKVKLRADRHIIET